MRKVDTLFKEKENQIVARQNFPLRKSKLKIERDFEPAEIEIISGIKSKGTGLSRYKMRFENKTA